MSAYQTTLSRRTRDVSATDFQFGAHKEYIDKDTVRLWNKYVPYTPSQLASLFTPDFPPMTDFLGEILRPGFEFRFADKNILYITIRPEEVWIGRDYSYRPGGFKLEANYDVIHQRMNSVSSLKVDPEFQDKKAGRALVRGMMEMALALKFPRFDFGVGGNGAYTWSRMGAMIDIPAEGPDYQLRRLREHLRRRLSAVAEWIPGEVNRAAEFCEVRRSDDLIRLVQMKDVVLPPDVINPSFDHFTDPSPLRRGVEQYFTTEKDLLRELSDISEVFGRAARAGRPPNLPVYLLSGALYDEFYVDFSDAAQMKHVGDYVGGWKTIGPAQGQPVEKLEAVPA